MRAALTEEVIFIGYLFDRLRRLGWSWWSIILATAALRGAYHAYQGLGAVVGNFAMGLVFGWCYRRWGRVMPLVIAHTLIDVVAFVGYPLAVALFPPSSPPDPSRGEKGADGVRCRAGGDGGGGGGRGESRGQVVVRQGEADGVVGHGPGEDDARNLPVGREERAAGCPVGPWRARVATSFGSAGCW